MIVTGRVSHEDIQNWYGAWNRRDWQGVALLLAESFELEDVALGRTIHGTQDYLKYSMAWASAFPDGTLKIERMIGSGNRGESVVVEYSSQGVQSGAWGAFAPSQRHTVIRFCDILRFEHDRLISCRTYGDYYQALRELGHLLWAQDAKKPEAA